jgi:hypothetical protein
MTPQIIRTLYINGANTGCGKTLSLVLVADYLWSKGMKRAYIDADPGNSGTIRSFQHFLKDQPVTKINVQDPEDLENIFNMTAESEVDVLVDLPGNSSSTMAKFWSDIAVPEMFSEHGIRLVTLLPVTSTDGVEPALNHMETVGPNGTFVICLNRIGYTPAPKPKEILFKEWMDVVVPSDYDVKTIEIPHLDKHALKALVASRCLPSKVTPSKATGVNSTTDRNIKAWAKKVHVQLDTIGLI